MFPSVGVKLLKPAKQTRSLAVTLILQSPKKNSLKPVQLIDVKREEKKNTRRKRLIVKRASDDIEAIWLENLSDKNLSLFRRTSFGSFRKISLDKLLDKLKEIYPTKFGNHTSVEERRLTSSTEEVANTHSERSKAAHRTKDGEGTVKERTASAEQEADACNEKAPPYLSAYVVKHIAEFPLLKTQSNSFANFAKEEKEDYGNVDAQTFPSVTAILNETMSPAVRAKLKRWKEKLIAQMGEEGFSKYQKDLLAQGSKFHSTLKTYLEVSDKNLVNIDPQIQGCWKSLENLLPDITDVRFVEEFVYHPILMYKGIVDCVAAYRGTPCVIEWKKSEKQKPELSDTYDAPLQLCAYLGALPWHKNVTIKSGLVVVAYTDGKPAKAFEMTLEDCELYWTEWLRRVQTYWLKRSPIIVKNEI